uniref:Uncharacterized protein n=1 Tax=Accipiter nisus TaxID=211598 RepID=A0A8B9MME7_9AVES
MFPLQLRLVHPSGEEKRRHKSIWLQVQLLLHGYEMSDCCIFHAVFSHAQHSSGSVLLPSAPLRQPAGAETGLVESCSVRQKQHYLNKPGRV